jgi:hypothetical protein
VSYDLLPESVLLQLKARIETIVPEEVLIFSESGAALDGVRSEINEYKSARIGQVRQRLTGELTNAPREVREKIERALADGNFLAANEYIDLALAGKELEPEEQDNPFDTYFPEFVRRIIAFLADRDRPDMSLIPDQIRAARTVGPIDMARVRAPQAAEAARMLEAWLQAKNRTGTPRFCEQLIRVFEAIGFENVSLNASEPQAGARKWWAELRATPLADRDICVLPQFGSGANGIYRILCTWERPSEEEIISAAARQAGQAPLIVVYFGQMTEQRRRELAELSRSRRRSFLLIDETLIFFLCSSRGSRLHVLFRCALPFTIADPYVTTASLVPPEMFFARAVERESVISPYGTNLVFGGRQLGKTALLRDVERRYHRPKEGSIVKWLDLAVERIGTGRPIEDIWSVLATALQADSIFGQGTASPDAFDRRVQQWLQEDVRRRIVLLLDESDAFLTADGKSGFSNLMALKGLMDDTNRRFKAVFAGLHNVQRTSRDVNTPLAHLQQPICIGPLLNGRDATEAIQLITKPLGDLGYRFESPALPMRILSHTNYYPSLIQIYSKHLVEYLTDATRRLFDPRETPPYVVTLRHLEAVQNAELREKILDKFRLTLDLDPRYRVIALCIALAGKDPAGEKAIVEGIDPASVREEAMFWWPAGFEQDTSLEAFHTILDEMIGLGILRKVGGRNYALRSPNLLNLLGTRKEIEERLLDATASPPPIVYEPATFRRALKSDPWVRSPITAEQESYLLNESNGVAILFGSSLSGLSEIETFIELACERVRYIPIRGCTSGGRFVNLITDSVRSADDGLTLIIVHPECPWTDTWIVQANAVLARKTSKQRFARIAFVADPHQAWWWSSLEKSTRDNLQAVGLRELSLRPWSESALRRWMEETGIAPGEHNFGARVKHVTGNWQAALHAFGSRCRTGTHRWRDCLDEIERDIQPNTEWLHRAGILPEALPVLRIMAELKEAVAPEDVVEFGAGLTLDRVERVIHWADTMAYARPTSRNAWILDDFLARLVIPGQ